MEKADFLCFDKNSENLKVIFSALCWSEMGVTFYVVKLQNMLYVKDELTKWAVFSCWYKFSKANSYFNNYWVGMVKNEQDLIYHGTLKSGVSHNWFDELSLLTE